MLQIHRWFILTGIIFIVFIALSVDFRLDRFDNNFNTWKAKFLVKAKEEGISEDIIKKFDETVKPQKKVFNSNYSAVDSQDVKPQSNNILDEQTSDLNSVDSAVSKYISDDIYLKSQMFYKNNLKTLQQKESEYLIPSSVVVSLFAVGSNFGEKNYEFNIIDVLSTKSVLGKYKEFYENELISFLKLVDLGYVELTTKSDVGGNFTFLGINPSAYLFYGVDSSKKMSVNLFTDKQDIYETAFYLLNQLGYNSNLPIGYKVDFSAMGISVDDYQGVSNKKTLTQWSQLGLKQSNGLSLPKNSEYATFIKINDTYGVLLLSNFDVIFKTNNNLEQSIAILLDSINLSDYAKQMKFATKYLKSSKKVKLAKSKNPKLDDMPTPKKYVNLK